MKLNIRLTILFFLGAVFFVSGQNSRTTERGALLGWSARTVGLGQSNFSSYSQPLDVLNNPAILANSGKDHALAYTHNEGLGGITKLDHLLLLLSRDSATYHVGINAFRMANSNVFETTNIYSGGVLDFNDLDALNNNDFGFKLMLARHLKSDSSSIGAELNLDLLSVTEFSSAVVLGLDLGYSLVLNNKMNYGLSVDNVLGKYYFWNQDSALLEASYFASGNYIKYKSTFIQLPYIQNAIDYLFYKQSGFAFSGFAKLGLGFGRADNLSINSNWINFHAGLGLEFEFFERLKLRGGIAELEREYNSLYLSPALGLGYSHKGLNLDYSWGDFYGKTIPLQKHVVSISLNLKSEKNNKINDITEPTRI